MYIFISLDKFCCGDIELKMDTKKLSGRMKKLPGIYRVDPKSQTTEDWKFKHETKPPGPEVGSRK